MMAAPADSHQLALQPLSLGIQVWLHLEWAPISLRYDPWVGPRSGVNLVLVGGFTNLDLAVCALQAAAQPWAAEQSLPRSSHTAATCAMRATTTIGKELSAAWLTSRQTSSIYCCSQGAV